MYDDLLCLNVPEMELFENLCKLSLKMKSNDKVYPFELIGFNCY